MIASNHTILITICGWIEAYASRKSIDETIPFDDFPCLMVLTFDDMTPMVKKIAKSQRGTRQGVKVDK